MKRREPMAYVSRAIRGQLFIRPVWRSDAAKRRGPMMAYDATASESRAAREAEGAASGNMFGSGSSNNDAIKTIVRWCCENMNDEETYRLSELLVKAISETPLGGKGNASVTAAMDAKELARWADYGRRFVAARAKPAADPTASAGTPEEEYHARYPHARRLKSGAL
jgi:hypothetical protein